MLCGRRDSKPASLSRRAPTLFFQIWYFDPDSGFLLRPSHKSSDVVCGAPVPPPPARTPFFQNGQLCCGRREKSAHNHQTHQHQKYTKMTWPLPWPSRPPPSPRASFFSPGRPARAAAAAQSRHPAPAGYLPCTARRPRRPLPARQAIPQNAAVNATSPPGLPRRPWLLPFLLFASPVPFWWPAPSRLDDRAKTNEADPRPPALPRAPSFRTRHAQGTASQAPPSPSRAATRGLAPSRTLHLQGTSRPPRTASLPAYPAPPGYRCRDDVCCAG